MRPCTRKSATTSPHSWLRWGATASSYFPRRSRAATAISNFSSARAVVERLVIDHVGHRGDGVAFGGGQTIFVPYTLGGEIVDTEPAADHADRRHLSRIERASAERIAPF